MAEDIECAVGITDFRYVRVRIFGTIFRQQTINGYYSYETNAISFSHCLRSVMKSTYKIYFRFP